jgi:hypothetical protein
MRIQMEDDPENQVVHITERWSLSMDGCVLSGTIIDPGAKKRILVYLKVARSLRTWFATAGDLGHL